MNFNELISIAHRNDHHAKVQLRKSSAPVTEFTTPGKELKSRPDLEGIKARLAVHQQKQKDADRAEKQKIAAKQAMLARPPVPPRFTNKPVSGASASRISDGANKSVPSTTTRGQPSSLSRSASSSNGNAPSKSGDFSRRTTETPGTSRASALQKSVPNLSAPAVKGAKKFRPLPPPASYSDLLKIATAVQQNPDMEIVLPKIVVPPSKPVIPPSKPVISSSRHVISTPASGSRTPAVQTQRPSQLVSKVPQNSAVRKPDGESTKSRSGDQTFVKRPLDVSRGDPQRHAASSRPSANVGHSGAVAVSKATGQKPGIRPVTGGSGSVEKPPTSRYKPAPFDSTGRIRSNDVRRPVTEPLNTKNSAQPSRNIPTPVRPSEKPTMTASSSQNRASQPSAKLQPAVNRRPPGASKPMQIRPIAASSSAAKTPARPPGGASQRPLGKGKATEPSPPPSAMSTWQNPYHRDSARAAFPFRPAAKKRPAPQEFDEEELDDEYDSDMADFIDDEDPEADDEDISEHISNIFGYDRKRYASRDSAPLPSETRVHAQWNEERLSALLGKFEDAREEELERQEMMKARKKVKTGR